MGEDEEVKTRRAIGQAAREARSALNKTQSQVADALGIAPEVYGRIERGLMMPSVTTLLKMASVLRITPDQLLGWAEVQKRKRSVFYERILAQLEHADEEALERAEAVLTALLATERKK